jgi:hypothetical protein
MKRCAVFFMVVSWCIGTPVLNASPESDRDEILRAVVQDVLTNPRLKRRRELYSSPGDAKFVLVSDPSDGIPWPTNLSITINGYELVSIPEGGGKWDNSKPPLLGIKLNAFDLSRTPTLSSAPVEVSIFNAGGWGRQAVIIIGGCSLYYVPKKEGTKWIVELDGYYCT